MMDKSWIGLSKEDPKFLLGLTNFIEFALKSSKGGKIVCPCTQCVNGKVLSARDVADHIWDAGFSPGYTYWSFHGETLSNTMDEGGFQHVSNSSGPDGLETNLNIRQFMQEMATGYANAKDGAYDGEHHNAGDDENILLNKEVLKFHGLMKELDEELFKGCKKHSKLSWILDMFHKKCMGKWSNKSFKGVLDSFRETFPDGEKLPKSSYEVKKLISSIGLSYEKIHACPNNCILFWKENINDDVCHVCGASRWKVDENNIDQNPHIEKKGKKKKAAKVLRWFPLKARLQKLFMCPETAAMMQWHFNERKKDDDYLRHPADARAWKEFDARYEDFSLDPRNVRLGLASDGFNPFTDIVHSTWPVVITIYNFPPWMCMKQPYLILSLLIPGPSSPGEKIDIFLQPLIDELNDLWTHGIQIYDAYTKSNFCMKAALMWTINDFPAYGMLSGWNTQSKFSCPSCGFDTCSEWLYHGGKYCFMGHRRFLRDDHPFRKNKRSFNGSEEWRSKPLVQSGSTIVGQWHGDIVIKNDKEEIISPHVALRKKSIFFKLPYWEFNLVRHNLDVMHIEKNVFDNISNTLLNIKDKTKDNLKARRDLERMRIRKDLHLTQLSNGKVKMPTAKFAMSPVEKDRVLGALKSVKVPDGYSSNISRCVKLKKHNMVGLKSHDCHILMQDLFPIAVRGSLDDKICQVVVDLCCYFREICGKVLKVSRLEELEKQIGETLSIMETIFPPSFFTISVHLVVHLATEAKLAGPVHYRWMYPIERYLGMLKSYVRNRAYPEGSMAEGYLADEAITLCSRYFKGVETKFNRPTRNSDEVEVTPQLDTPLPIIPGRSIGQEEDITIDGKTLMQAHRYILYNCDSVQPFIEEHKSFIKQKSRKRRRNPSQVQAEIEKEHLSTFTEWFRNQVDRLSEMKSPRVTEHIKWLAQGPNKVGKRFKGYLIKGMRFQTKEVEDLKKTQNSGIVVMTKTSGLENDIPYYGVLNDIIELNYFERFKVVLFRGDWIDVERGRGIKEDRFGYTLVDLSKLVHTGVHLNDEPFVIASQVQQVFYVQDPLQHGWKVVVKSKPRDTYDMGDEFEIEFFNGYQNHLGSIGEEAVEQDEVNWVRTDMDHAILDDDTMVSRAHDE